MTTTQTIDNSADLIDSRDIIARIAELQRERQSWIDGEWDENSSLHHDHQTKSLALRWAARFEDEAEELDALVTFATEAEDYTDDWHHGVTLIRDTYFVEYVQDLLADCGTIPSDLPSWVVLDWDATAENMQVDYTSVELDGVTYWVR